MARTQHRSIRIPDDIWAEALARTQEEGVTVADLVRRYLAWWLSHPNARMPARPRREVKGDTRA